MNAKKLFSIFFLVMATLFVAVGPGETRAAEVVQTGPQEPLILQAAEGRLYPVFVEVGKPAGRPSPLPQGEVWQYVGLDPVSGLPTFSNGSRDPVPGFCLNKDLPGPGARTEYRLVEEATLQTTIAALSLEIPVQVTKEALWGSLGQTSSISPEAQALIDAAEAYAAENGHVPGQVLRDPSGRKQDHVLVPTAVPPTATPEPTPTAVPPTAEPPAETPTAEPPEPTPTAEPPAETPELTPTAVVPPTATPEKPDGANIKDPKCIPSGFKFLRQYTTQDPIEANQVLLNGKWNFDYLSTLKWDFQGSVGVLYPDSGWPQVNGNPITWLHSKLIYGLHWDEYEFEDGGILTDVYPGLAFNRAEAPPIPSGGLHVQREDITNAWMCPAPAPTATPFPLTGDEEVALPATGGASPAPLGAPIWFWGLLGVASLVIILLVGWRVAPAGIKVRKD
jgi:hypothetical protein